MTLRSERGFSFIEVLVAMLVLGIAVLAFAGLQVRSLESTGVAHTRSQAMTLAAEFVERMRSNPSAMATYRAGPYAANAFPSGQPEDWAPTCIRTVVTNDGCTAIQMATFDLREIQFLANQLLPLGRVDLRDCTGGTMGIDCVFIGWGGTDPADCDDNSSPNCVSMRAVIQ